MKDDRCSRLLNPTSLYHAQEGSVLWVNLVRGRSRTSARPLPGDRHCSTIRGAVFYGRCACKRVLDPQRARRLAKACTSNYETFTQSAFPALTMSISLQTVISIDVMEFCSAHCWIEKIRVVRISKIKYYTYLSLINDLICSHHAAWFPPEH